MNALHLSPLFALALACTSTTSPSTFPDGGNNQVHGCIDAGAVSAKGGGFCCAAIIDKACSGEQPLGGWAATADECCGVSTGYPDTPYAGTVDSHGCTMLVPDPTRCCGPCVKDAGTTD